MNSVVNYTAIIEKDEEMFTSFCPELDIASQGETPEEAESNLKEAIKLFLECASEDEIIRRNHQVFKITQVQVSISV